MSISSFLHGLVGKKYQVGSQIVICSEPDAMNKAINDEVITDNTVQADLTACKKSLVAVSDLKGQLEQQLASSTDEKNQQISILSQTISTLQGQFDELKGAYTTLVSAKSTTNDMDWTKLVTPAVLQKLQDNYTKYPEAGIFYNGRSLPDGKTRIEMQVQSWAQYGMQTPELISYINSNHLTVAECMATNNIGFHRACDLVLMKIKHTVNQIYNYQYDSQTAQGQSEYWKFAIETYLSGKVQIGSDCEDWAHLNYVLCRIAGIPAPMLRIACGMTYGNEGHSTNYYFASDGTWRFCNSTSTYPDVNDALQLNVQSSSAESLNLKTTWFSFNDEKSWAGWSTAAHEDTFNEVKDNNHHVLKHIRIDWNDI